MTENDSTSVATATGVAAPSIPERCRRLTGSSRFQRAVLTLIIINAVILGLQAIPAVAAAVGPALDAADQIIVAIFVVELVLRYTGHGMKLLRDPWAVFDTLVVGVSVIPASEGLAVLRTLRVLRVLRTVSAVPRLRRVVSGLLGAIPGLGAVVALLGLIFYVAGVMATQLFGATFPAWFGSLPLSIYSLFQIMTLESWSMGIVRPVMEVHPYAWAFFVPFIAIATFTMLNLFIAVVVNAMQGEAEVEHQAEVDAAAAAARADKEEILTELRALRQEVATLRERVEPPS